MSCWIGWVRCAVVGCGGHAIFLDSIGHTKWTQMTVPSLFPPFAKIPLKVKVYVPSNYYNYIEY